MHAIKNTHYFYTLMYKIISNSIVIKINNKIIYFYQVRLFYVVVISKMCRL